jgi:hypothetical protein
VEDIDVFASLLLDEGKRFLEKAVDSDNEIEKQAYLHASLLLAFCSLDAHLNAVAAECAARSDLNLSPHDLSILLEREVRLEDGAFALGTNLRMVRYEDRIQFLHCRVSKKNVDKTSKWWSDLMSAIALRNELTHPKGVPNIKVENVSRAITAIVDTLEALYRAIYKRKFPALGRGLDSNLSF